MSIAHVIIIIKSEVSTFPIVIIFFRGCVSVMFVISYSVTYNIYIPGKPGIVQFMMSANSPIRFDLKIIFVYLYITPSHYHHCASLSEDIELIKCLSDIVCQVCKIRHIISVIHYKTGEAVCFQLTHFPCDDWENIYTLSYYHHRIGSMNYYPLFKVGSLNNGVHSMSFCILMGN